MKATAIRGGAITIVAQFLRILIHFGSVVILSRLLDPGDFGLFAIVMSIVGVSEVIRDLGLSAAALQAERLTQKQKSNLFWINTGAGAVCAVLVVAISFPLASWYDDDRLTMLCQSTAIVFVLNGICTQFRVELNRDLKFQKLGLLDTLPLALGLVSAIAAAVLGLGYWALPIQAITAAIIGLALAVAMAHWCPSRPSYRSETVGLVRFGLDVSGTQVIGYLTRNIDTAIVGLVSTIQTAGGYNRSAQLLLAPVNQISAPLTRVALPVLSKIHRDGDRFESALVKSQTISCYAVSTIYLVAAALAVPIVDISLGRNWGFIAPIFAVLAISGIFRALNQVLYWGYLASGQTRKLLVNYVIFQPIIVIGAVVGSRYGALGVAYGVACGSAVYWTASALKMKRDLSLHSYSILTGAVRSVGFFGAPIAIGASIASKLSTETWTSLLFGLAGGVCAALVCVILIKSVRRDLSLLFNSGRTLLRKESSSQNSRPSTTEGVETSI
ncbi:lipopolysaccharide biosynthesis protein [Rhodococcus sp. ABRD24]|uniref:lipopolysaccharide biosynthesis protein n=1 Tax=Rhodococcus sp. ABRD24 TaxID=2507582 RepID=UPI001F60578B|nr:lipopolysaccharide biosynthesis protein [Rhodococcus sp. ABRD24]